MAGKITIEQFTVGELSDMEMKGASFASEQDIEKVTTLLALFWVLNRRENPAYTYEMARNQALPTVTAYLSERMGPDPLDAAEEASGNVTSLTSAPSASSTASRRRRSGA